VQDIDANHVASNSVTTVHEAGTSDKFRVNFYRSALKAGYAVGWAPGYTTVIDPREETDDAAALQNVNDDLIANAVSAAEFGVVWIPAEKPDGSAWSIESTVTFGDSSNRFNVMPRGWGFSATGRAIQTTITDGSPVFEITGDTTNNKSAAHLVHFGGFALDGGNNDAVAIKITDTLDWTLDEVALDNFAPTADGGVVVDGACFGWVIGRLKWAGGSASSDVIHFKNSTGNGPPGNGVVTSHVNVTGPHASAISTSTKNPPIRVGGHYEASEGDACLDLTDGSWILTTDLSIGTLKSGPTDSVFFDGERLAVGPTNLGAPAGAGDVVHIGSNASQFFIQPFYRVQASLTGDDLNIESGAASNTSYVPFPEAFRGTVTRPTANPNIVYPNGGHLWTEFSGQSHTTGGETNITNISGGQDDYFEARNVKTSSSVSSPWAVDWKFRYDGSSFTEFFMMWEDDPGSDMNFSGEIYRFV
jgi:hypothetical protein